MIMTLLYVVFILFLGILVGGVLTLLIQSQLKVWKKEIETPDIMDCWKCGSTMLEVEKHLFEPTVVRCKSCFAVLSARPKDISDIFRSRL